MQLEHHGLVGNCQASALISDHGAVTWCCLPRFDAEPVFGALLDEADGGSFLVGPASGGRGVQRYVENTNVLETRFEGPDGAFRVVDFMPRFSLYERHFRPAMLMRLLEPLSGTPRVVVRCEPRLGWSKRQPSRVQGSNHVSWAGYGAEVRLTTDVALSYLDALPFALTGPRHLALTWGAPIEEPLAPLCERFRRETEAYWRRWVKGCDVPPHYQREVIRSALALKLHCFDDTGAIIAATTTSIPEAPGSGRTWDYRYCWLRDAYYALGAFGLLGQFEERERFTEYLLNVASSSPDLDLRPVYRLDGKSDLDERVLPEWKGYGGEGPVRVGNAAVSHRQLDIYGEMVLALVPAFLDERFQVERSKATLDLLTRLSRKAVQVAGQPDTGIWEHRKAMTPQTFSSLMCWAAADRMATVAGLHLKEAEAEFKGAAAALREDILKRAWSPTLQSLVATWDGDTLDAALLQAAPLRFLPASDARLASTVDAIVKDLGREGWLLRYRTDDGLGVPRVAFVICTFWLIEALAVLGRRDEARAALERVCASLSPLGLLSEDWDPATLRLWGNFPQAYSHVGMIHAAFAASPRWTDVL